jgi:hypothetical protein
MVPVAPIITGIALVFTSHIRCISVVRSLYFVLLLLLFPLAQQPSAGYGLLVPRGFVIAHNDAPQSVGLWTSEIPSIQAINNNKACVQ